MCKLSREITVAAPMILRVNLGERKFYGTRCISAFECSEIDAPSREMHNAANLVVVGDSFTTFLPKETSFYGLFQDNKLRKVVVEIGEIVSKTELLLSH